jgi:hypothetical protein
MNLEQERIVREELWRSIVWAGLGIVGWPTVVAEVAWVDQNLFTVFGLPVIMWAVLTAGMIGFRTVTDAELQRDMISLPAYFVEAAILGGIGAVYLVTAGGYSPLLVATGYVSVGAATVVWYRYAGVFNSTTETTG